MGLKTMHDYKAILQAVCLETIVTNLFFETAKLN